MEAQSIPALNNDIYTIKAFDDRTISFFDALSKKILAHSSINRLPEMVALAFWIRKSNLNKIKEDNSYLFKQPNVLLSPLGKVFHV